MNQHLLLSLLLYDAYTGLFSWRYSRGRVQAGQQAGNIQDTGYIRMKINGKNYLAHRLAWLYVYGYFPEYDIDHKDGIRNNNKLVNLREVGRRCNQQNTKVKSNNTSGYVGVSWHVKSGKWQSTIRVNQKDVYLGLFNNKLDAAIVRLEYEDSCLDWTCDLRNVNRQKVLADKALRR